MEEEGMRPARPFTVRSWSDVVSIASVFIMALAGLSWGLKLESRVDSLLADHARMDKAFDSRIADIYTILNKGSLPVSAARLDGHDERIRHLEAEVVEFSKKVVDTSSRGR